MLDASSVTIDIKNSGRSAGAHLFCMVWGPSVDDFEHFCLRSILQPNNLPWLLRSNYAVRFDIFTISRDAERIKEIVRAGFAAIDLSGTSLIVNINVYDGLDGGAPDEVARLKWTFLERQMTLSIETGIPTAILPADVFYGDGSFRNAFTYAKNPGSVVCGMYLRVRREAAIAAIESGMNRWNRSISNARLVGIALRTMIPGFIASIVDADENASYHTGASLRQLDDCTYTYISHLPSPFVYNFVPNDRYFFSVYAQNRYESIDHLWAVKLIAEQRWRVLASSDLMFLAELTPDDTATRHHTYPIEPGRRYNEAFIGDTMYSRVNQCIVGSLRAEFD